MTTDGPDAEAPEEAVEALLAGAVVGIPTDTVYGLAVDPRRGGATDAVFALKRRPARLELPVLVAGVEQAADLAGPGGLPGLARRLAERFWPGALTIVVARRSGLDWDLGGDGRTIGLRCPAHPVARRLCEEVGPLATTSANRHGAPAMTTAAQLSREFGHAVAVVVDGGLCDGTPSTVVDVTGETVRSIRDGAVPWNDVVEAAGGR
ncbi:MAG TPA: L-threonylcarbamoyladenylate synthase [Acidimicrobiales bacterium]|nr:L-threonylcarbamoyladenylate synthase [Acidimicrobiales bacterium]